MKHQIIRGALLLALCAILLAWSALEVSAAGQDLQYLAVAPKMQPATQDQNPPPKPNRDALALWESLQTTAQGWTGIVEAYTLTGVAQKAGFTSDTGETKQARLTALGENAFMLQPLYARFGRLFYPEEFEKGSDGILLDEQLALALFKISEPIGRTVTFSGMTFTVMGIVRHVRQVGDGEDYGAYVTLASLWDREVQLEALQVTARPIQGAGARSVFASDMESWQAGGTLIDLGKEGLAALLPLRALIILIGACFFFWALRGWNGQFLRFFADYKLRLQRQYALQLMPRLTLGTIILALGYAALAGLAALLVQYFTEPVYTFTDWVPAVLVEWKDINAAFWRVWQGMSSLCELRSPELLRIRFFARVTAWSAAAAAISFTRLWVRLKGRLGERYNAELRRP